MKHVVKLRTGNADVRRESGRCVVTSKLALRDARSAAAATTATGIGIELLFVNEHKYEGGSIQWQGLDDDMRAFVHSARQIVFASPNVLKKVCVYLSRLFKKEKQERKKNG